MYYFYLLYFVSLHSISRPFGWSITSKLCFGEQWEDSLNEKYPHIVNEEHCKACDAEPNSVEDSGDKLEGQ